MLLFRDSHRQGTAYSPLWGYVAGMLGWPREATGTERECEGCPSSWGLDMTALLRPPGFSSSKGPAAVSQPRLLWPCNVCRQGLCMVPGHLGSSVLWRESGALTVWAGTEGRVVAQLPANSALPGPQGRHCREDTAVFRPQIPRSRFCWSRLLQELMFWFFYFVPWHKVFVLSCFSRKNAKRNKNNTVLPSSRAVLAEESWYERVFTQVGIIFGVSVNFFKIKDAGSVPSLSRSP